MEENLTCQRKRAVNVYRISSLKQFDSGNSLKDQQIICQACNKRNNHILVTEFEVVETGADKEREQFTKVLEYCKDPINKIDVVVIKSIDRFTRGGYVVYDRLKTELAKAGVELLDAYGYIQQPKNTLEHLGTSYEWSFYSPSEQAEMMQSAQSQQERRDILTRLIGAEIIYTRSGYGIRQAPPGYFNQKIETKDGKRVIRKPHPQEAHWFIKMFELRAECVLSDKEIVEKINDLGYQSRQRFRRDESKQRRIIGRLTPKKLTVKQFQRYISNPVYAGVICEKMTAYKPVQARFEGLVSIELFNQANRGKIFIVKTESELKILYNQKPYPDIQRKTHTNVPLW